MAYDNNDRQNWNNKPRWQPDPNTTTTNVAPFQATALFDVPGGVLVRLGDFRITKMTDDDGVAVLALNLLWANTETLVKNRWGIVPVKLTKTIQKDLFQVVYQLDVKAAWDKVSQGVSLAEWNRDIANRVVCLYVEEKDIPDRREEKRTGQKVTKLVKMLRVRPAPAGYDAPQNVIEPASQNVPEQPKPLSAKSWFTQRSEDQYWRPLMALHAPATGASDLDYLKAKMKAAPIVKLIEENEGKTLNDLKPECDKYLVPWTMQDVMTILECDAATIYPLTLKEVRDNMAAVFS